MPRKDNQPRAATIVLSEDSRFMLGRLELALKTVVNPELEPSRSWMIAQCIAFAYSHSPAFVAGYLPGEQDSEDRSHVQVKRPAVPGVSPQAETPGPQATGGSGTDPVHSVSGDPRPGDGPPEAHKPKRPGPRVGKTLPGRDSQSQ